MFFKCPSEPPAQVQVVHLCFSLQRWPSEPFQIKPGSNRSSVKTSKKTRQVEAAERTEKSSSLVAARGPASQQAFLDLCLQTQVPDSLFFTLTWLPW